MDEEETASRWEDHTLFRVHRGETDEREHHDPPPLSPHDSVARLGAVLARVCLVDQGAA